MKWWRIRKVANASAWHLMMVAIGVLAGIALVAFLPGMPWVSSMGDAPTNLDLGAQRSMAAAAWWMVGITGASTAVGTLGLYLIARTLQEAKRSADAGEQAVRTTERIGKRQVRAYLSIENAIIKLDQNHIFFTVDADIRNSGQSPAKNIRGTSRLRFVEFHNQPDGDVATEDLLVLPSDFQAFAVGAGQLGKLRLTFTVIFSKPPVREIFEGYAYRAIEVDVDLAYVDVFGDEDHDALVLRSTIKDLDQAQSGLALRVGSKD